jgi:hypothetical protein
VDHFFVEEPEPIYVRDKTKHLIIYTPNKFKDLHVDNREFIKEWMSDMTKRRYKSIASYPDNDECPDDCYNSWVAPEASFISPSDNIIDLQLILYHIWIMAGKDDAGKNAILDFLAQILQQPNKLVGMAILLYGEQGVGKDIIFSWFGNHVLGEQQYYFVGNAKALFGQFNSDFPSKTFIQCDELDKATVQKEGDNLKRLITGHKVRSEGKGEKGKQVNSFNRFVMTTNNRDTLKIERTDRRYMIFETASDYINNTQYFKTLIECLEKPEVIRAFYDFLMARDISNFNSENRPKTKLYLEMKREGIDVVSKWIRDDTEDTFEEPRKKAIEWLCLFNDWAVKSGFYRISITRFGLLVNTLVDKNIGITRKKPEGISYIIIDRNVFNIYLEKNDLFEM